MFKQRLSHVFRTGGGKPATGRIQRANSRLVYPEESDEEFREHGRYVNYTHNGGGSLKFQHL
jgi:hypothetical protein